MDAEAGCCPLCRQAIPNIGDEVLLNPTLCTVQRGDKIAHLSMTQFDVFQAIFRRYPNQVLRETIILDVWGIEGRAPAYLSFWTHTLRTRLRPLKIQVVTIAGRNGLYTVRLL